MPNKVKEIMKQRGISASELSESTGIGRTTIYQIINSKCITNIDYAFKISKYLGISVQELFFLDEL